MKFSKKYVDFFEKKFTIFLVNDIMQKSLVLRRKVWIGIKK